jgi:hypothetical protein
LGMFEKKVGDFEKETVKREREENGEFQFGK